MGFRLLILTEGVTAIGEGDAIDEWPSELKALVPDIQVDLVHTTRSAEMVIGHADAAFGYIGPELFNKANKLKWIQAPAAGPKAGFYHKPMVDSEVVVTNIRGIFSDHISAHIMSFVLTFARGLHIYMRQQFKGEWRQGHASIHLPEATALVVGVGGIGGETARRCESFGMTILGVDARLTTTPPFVQELHGPDALTDLLPRADFVIVTVPETPGTQGMFTKKEFSLMKPSSYFINIGRGATVSLDDLTYALQKRQISGAALDVFETEPLPPNHPLWSLPEVIITPHIAAAGPYCDQRRREVFFDNCVRFNEGKKLKNVVDKVNWF